MGNLLKKIAGRTALATSLAFSGIEGNYNQDYNNLAQNSLESKVNLNENYQKIDQKFLKDVVERGEIGYKKVFYFLAEIMLYNNPELAKGNEIEFKRDIVDKYYQRLKESVDNKKVIGYFTNEPPITTKDVFFSYNKDKINKIIIDIARKLKIDPNHYNFWGGSIKGVYLNGNKEYLEEEFSLDKEVIRKRNRKYNRISSKEMVFEDLKETEELYFNTENPDTIFIYPSVDSKININSLMHETLHLIFTHYSFDQQQFCWFVQAIEQSVKESFLPEKLKEDWKVEDYNLHKFFNSINKHPQIKTQKEFFKRLKKNLKSKTKEEKTAKKEYKKFVKELSKQYDWDYVWER